MVRGIVMARAAGRAQSAHTTSCSLQLDKCSKAKSSRGKCAGGRLNPSFAQLRDGGCGTFQELSIAANGLGESLPQETCAELKEEVPDHAR